MRIAVAGSTGLVGTLVSAEARSRGHAVVELARARGVDLITGRGVREAVAGADVVIDVANVATTRAAVSTTFFTRATATLLDAGRDAGVQHHLALSVVGVDRAPHGYNAGKHAQEQLVEASGLNWTILRATQFHEFAPQVWAMAKLGRLHLAPSMRTQPVAAHEVAARLVDLAEQPALHARAELAGPREERLADMVRRWARATGTRGAVVEIPLPGPAGRAQRDGSMLPSGRADTGRETFEEWLGRTARA